MGYEVHVVTPLRPGTLRNEVIDLIRVHRYPYWGWRKGTQLGELKGTPILLLGSLIGLGIVKCVLTILKYRVNLVHAFWIVPGGLIAVISAGLTGRPVIGTAAGSDLNSAPKKLMARTFVMITLKRLDRLIAVSEALKNVAIHLGLPAEKAIVISGPIGVNLLTPYKDTEKKDGKKTYSCRVIYVGNLSRPKRVDILLKSMNAVVAKNSAVTLEIVGDGNLRTELVNLVDELNLGPYVTFHGSVPHEEIPSLLLRATIFIHCSEDEGLPVAIIEAMTCGLPVVASNVGGIPELVENGKNGFILDPEDIHGFAEKITLLCENSKLRGELGSYGRNLVRRILNKEDTLAKLKKVYQNFLPEK